VRHGGAERPGLRPFGVDVDPLVIAGDIGECVDPGLVDDHPVAGAEIGARRLEQLRGAGEP